MKLFLDSLLIDNYRIFRHLEIERLGRANLIVGRNNAGKSTVLEALRLYASGGSEQVLWSILESHDETRGSASEQVEDRLFAVQQLFHGRDSEWHNQKEIRIGSTRDLKSTLRLSVGNITEQTAPFATSHGQRVSNTGPTLSVIVGDDAHRVPMDVDWTKQNIMFRFRASEQAPTRQGYVPPCGLTEDIAATQWDMVALTDLEDAVIDALRIISPEIERISFIGEHGRNRVPVAKLTNHPKPVPLRSLGDGVNRMLGIALSLVAARGGVLLLDEVENGIHFTAQERVWRLIFQTAHRLDIQVFATTHSWDCIEAFQRAAADDQHEDAVLVRLDVRRDAISPTTFSEHDLSIVTREQIEVR